MRALVLALVLAGLKAPSAGQILRRAEDVRNPDLRYAVDFTIHGVARGAHAAERDASYAMIADGKDKTVILMKTPVSLYGAVMLMADQRYFMLLPRATRAWELSPAQMLAGDVATGDLARSNLLRGYAPTLAGEETIEGEPCFRLELAAAGERSHYARIVYWVAKRRYLPVKLEHYGRDGALSKTVRYGDYRQGALGLRSMRLEVESFGDWKEASTLVFSNLRKLDPAPLEFTATGILPFRDAALAAGQLAGGGEVGMADVLGVLRKARP